MLRHVREDFRQAAVLRGDEAVRAITKGREELQSMRRMSAVSQLYPQVSHHAVPCLALLLQCPAASHLAHARRKSIRWSDLSENAEF